MDKMGNLSKTEIARMLRNPAQARSLLAAVRAGDARLGLTDAQRDQAAALLTTYLSARSPAARLAATRDLVEMVVKNRELRARLGSTIGDLAKAGGIAVRTRGRALLARVAKPEP